MSPESRIAYEKKLKKVKRNRKILAAFILLAVAAAAAAVLSMTVLFNITSIEVKNPGKVYDAKEIISASGLSEGENMVRTDFESAEKRIESTLPYILSANISKSLSGRITITVKDDTAAVIFRVRNGYALADSDGKVLEILKEKPKDTSLKVLKTSAELSASAGKTMDFADEYEKEIYNELCTEMKNSGLFDKVTEIDISDPANIRIVYQNRMRIKLGTASELGDKLSAAAKVIAEEDKNDPSAIAEINVTVPKKVYVNPLNSLEKTTAAEKKAEDETDDSADAGQEEQQETEKATDENSVSENEEESTSDDEDTTTREEEDTIAPEN